MGSMQPPQPQQQPRGASPVTGPQQQQQQQPQPRQPTYPWSQRKLNLNPPVVLPRPGVAPPQTPSPSPFPRYGHALPSTATGSGELFLFGGLVREQVRNDVYLISTRELSATLLQTTGEIPSPRVGHASALVGSVLIVWGGDTKTSNKSKPSDSHDDGLYLLNLCEFCQTVQFLNLNCFCTASREWTRVSVQGPAPRGRYGHSVCMVGSKFFVFGGQVDGEFLNDLWSFDLNSRNSHPPTSRQAPNHLSPLVRTKAVWELIEPTLGSPRPSHRTGHVMVSYGDKLVVCVLFPLPPASRVIHPE